MVLELWKKPWWLVLLETSCEYASGVSDETLAKHELLEVSGFICTLTGTLYVCETFDSSWKVQPPSPIGQFPNGVGR